MSRRPFSRYWKGPVVFVAAALGAFTALLWTDSHALAVAALVIAVVAYGVYAVGNSSDLPGTSGDHDKNVRT